MLREVLGRIVAAVGGDFVEWDCMAGNWVEGSLEQDCIAGVVEPVEPGCIVEGCETSLALEILGWDDIVEVGAFVKCNAAVVVVVEWEHNVVAVVDEESGESVVVVEGVQFVVWGYIAVVVVVERFPVREYIVLAAEDRSPEELDKTMKAVQVLGTEAPGYTGGQARTVPGDIAVVALFEGRRWYHLFLCLQPPLPSPAQW